MKAILEIAELVLERTKKIQHINRKKRTLGLCGVSLSLRIEKIISPIEEELFDKWMKTTVTKERSLIHAYDLPVYYWPAGDFAVRIEWLENQIKKELQYEE